MLLQQIFKFGSSAAASSFLFLLLLLKNLDRLLYYGIFVTLQKKRVWLLWVGDGLLPTQVFQMFATIEVYVGFGADVSLLTDEKARTLGR